MTEPQHRSQDSVAPDDTRAGLAMFAIFTSAVLIVTGAVAIVALVDTWWILGLAFAIHVLVTTGVLATIITVVNGRADATEPARPPACQPGPRARRPAGDHGRRRRGATSSRLVRRELGSDGSTIVPTVSRHDVDAGRT